MPSRRVIGVDMGGTKLLAGVVDRGLSVHHRVQRTVVGLDQSAVIATVLDAIMDIRAQAGDDIDAIGFEVRCTLDRRTGRAVQAVKLALAFDDLVARELPR
jgi:glucokinase